MKKILNLIVLWVLLGLCFPANTFAQESAQKLSAQALEECHKGRSAKVRDVRLAHFERGQVLAERAVQLNDQLADAHFALFCSLGEKSRLDGEFLSAIFESQRLLNALDRTLDLDPTHLDALSSKGTLLIKLPELIGGDSERGERMLRRVIEKDPTAINARMVLAQACAERGEQEEAMTLAKQALALALAKHRQDLIPEAEATLIDVRTQSQ